MTSLNSARLVSITAGRRLTPVAPTKSTVTTSPGSGMLLVLQEGIDMLPARLPEIAQIFFRPFVAVVHHGVWGNIVQDQRRQAQAVRHRQRFNGLFVYLV